MCTLLLAGSWRLFCHKKAWDSRQRDCEIKYWLELLWQSICQHFDYLNTAANTVLIDRLTCNNILIKSILQSRKAFIRI